MNVAIILAAGESRRMGEPKQLLPFAGKTMLECVVGAFDSPQIDATIVVLGHKADEIVARLELRPPKVRIATNPNWKAGMFTSVQAGLRALPAGTKVALIGLCDQPRLKRATVENLMAQFSGKILIPTFNGRQGHPLLLDGQYAREILAMDETSTLKHFLANHPDEIARLPVADEGVLIDIDDRVTYERERHK